MSAKARYASNIPKLYAIRLLFWMQFFAAVLVPFYTDWGGVTLADVFLINAWFFLCNFALEVPTGTVADFLGRRTSLLLGSVVGAVGVLFYAWRPSFAFFLAAEAVMAVAYTLHSGADEALAYDSLKADGRQARAAHVISRMESFKLGGIIAATIVGGFIAAGFGLRAPMQATALPMTLAALVALTLREPPGGNTLGPQRGYGTLLRDGARVFVSLPVVRKLAIEAAIVNAMAWGIIWLFQPLLTRAGLPLSAFGIVHALGCAAQIAFLSSVPALERVAGSRRRLIRLTTAGGGVAMLALAGPAWPPLVIAGIVGAMGLSLVRLPLLMAAVNHHVGSGERATVLSFCGMTRQLAIVLVNPAIGAIAGRSLPAALLVMGTALLAAALLSRITDAELEPPLHA
jgi:MFS family permease